VPFHGLQLNTDVVIIIIIIIIMLPNQAIASMPSAPRPSGANTDVVSRQTKMHLRCATCWQREDKLGGQC
jgi:hypothetical protein